MILCDRKEWNPLTFSFMRSAVEMDRIQTDGTQRNGRKDKLVSGIILCNIQVLPKKSDKFKYSQIDCDAILVCEVLMFFFSPLHLVITRQTSHQSHTHQWQNSYSVDAQYSPLFSLYGLLTLLPFEHWCSHFSQDHRVLCRNDLSSSAVWSAYVKSTSFHFAA